MKYIYGKVSHVVSMMNKAVGHKESPQNKLLELFTIVVQEHQFPKVIRSWLTQSIHLRHTDDEEPIPLNVNKTQDIFGMICKAFLWEKHMQKQKYCC